MDYYTDCNLVCGMGSSSRRYKMKLESHMLYCYNKNPCLVYYLYMVDSNTAYLFPQFKRVDVNSVDVKQILDFHCHDFRLVSKYPCNVRPCLVYQKQRYVCIGLASPYFILPLFSDMLDMMHSTEAVILPPFTRGKICTDHNTNKRYEYISQNSFGFDELLFRDCETQDIAIFQGDELIAFEESESE